MKFSIAKKLELPPGFISNGLASVRVCFYILFLERAARAHQHRRAARPDEKQLRVK